MTASIFFPPITFSKIIIDWNQIGFLNYFRAIIFLVGCAFLPGACIFKIISPNSTLHERFRIEPFFLKITIYPLLSFSFLGVSTLILETTGLIRVIIGDFYTSVMFLMIIILFILNLLIQKHRGNNNFSLSLKEIKISRSTLLILFFALGIVIVALGVHLFAKYLLPFDSWRGISYAYLINHPDTTPTDKFYTYAIYWGYNSFGLSALSGIPAININVMLFPFLYLFATSTFLLMKALLFEFKECYAVLSTILAVTFSGLF